MSGMIHFLDINKYILSDPIGRGSFSNVYKVVDRIKGQIYAVKIYREKFDDFPDDALSPFNELSIITKLHHPSIISYIGFCMYGFQPDEYPSIFMEYAHKGSLIDFICSHKLLNDTQRLIIIYGIASAMKYLHSKNIVHADLKPANVLLDENFYPKLSDFNLSIIIENEVFVSNKEFGTPVYIALKLLMVMILILKLMYFHLLLL